MSFSVLRVFHARLRGARHLVMVACSTRACSPRRRDLGVLLATHSLDSIRLTTARRVTRRCDELAQFTHAAKRGHRASACSAREAAHAGQHHLPLFAAMPSSGLLASMWQAWRRPAWLLLFGLDDKPWHHHPSRFLTCSQHLCPGCETNAFVWVSWAAWATVMHLISGLYRLTPAPAVGGKCAVLAASVTTSLLGLTLLKRHPCGRRRWVNETPANREYRRPACRHWSAAA